MDLSVGFRRLFIIIAKQESSISEKLKVTILYSKDYDGTGLCEASLAPLYITSEKVPENIDLGFRKEKRRDVKSKHWVTLWLTASGLEERLRLLSVQHKI